MSVVGNASPFHWPSSFSRSSLASSEDWHIDTKFFVEIFVNNFHCVSLECIQWGIQFRNQLSFPLVRWFATTDNFNHFICPCAVTQFTESGTHSPCFILASGSAHMLLPADFDRTEICLSLRYSQTDVAIASVYALYTIQHMVSVLAGFSFQHMHIIAQTGTLVKYYCCDFVAKIQQDLCWQARISVI